MKKLDEKITGFCLDCIEDVSCYVSVKLCKDIFEGKTIVYNEKVLTCSKCGGTNVDNAQIADENVALYGMEASRVFNIITVEQIKELLEKYNIKARPLANLLGWGEVTIARYLAGKIPEKRYSDILLDLLFNEKAMKKLIEINGSSLTYVAYKKVIKRLDELDKLDENNKALNATKYMLSREMEITPLEIQKILYFTNLVNCIIYGKLMFENECEAWVHGPVYKDIYQKHIEYGKSPINDSVDLKNYTFNLNFNEREIVDIVLESFGSYSAGKLRNMTHLTTPWVNSRKGYDDCESSNVKIMSKRVKEYAEYLKEKFNIRSNKDICNLPKYILESE